MSRSPLFKLALVLVLLSSEVRLHAQRLVGYVPVAEATTSGTLTTSGEKNFLGASSSISALQDRQAHVTLSRGGSLLVCQASIVHINDAFNPLRPPNETLDPLLFALDRGGVELQMPFTRSDAITVGGMRFSSGTHSGKLAPLDLAVALKPNGDTCVESRGKHSPTLSITDAFGHPPYLLKAGDHVLFEHGLIQESAIRDTSSCGCPPPPALGSALADAALRAGAGNQATFDLNGSSFPFPASTSAEASSNTEPSAAPNPVQVAGTLVYDPGAPETQLDTDPSLVLASRNSFSPASPDALAALDPNPGPSRPVDPGGRRKLAFAPPPQDTETLASLKRPLPTPTPEVNPVYKQTLSTPPPSYHPKAGLFHSIGRFFKGMVNP